MRVLLAYALTPKRRRIARLLKEASNGYDVRLLQVGTGEELGTNEKGVVCVVPPLPLSRPCSPRPSCSPRCSVPCSPTAVRRGICARVSLSQAFDQWRHAAIHLCRYISLDGTCLQARQQVTVDEFLQGTQRHLHGAAGNGPEVPF